MILPNPKQDLAAAGAALLFNILPGLMALPASERYEALRLHILTALEAFEMERKLNTK